MELISKTDLLRKNPGDTLTSKEINSLNSTVNMLVEFANGYLSKYCDVNIEFGQKIKEYTAKEAIGLVPTSRRNLGFKVKYRSKDEKYYEIVYVGHSVSAEEWENLDNWSPVMITVDGGEI